MRGIDISHYQGKPNFKLLAAAPDKPDFIYLKATQGTGYIDPNCKVNATEAVKQGFRVGYYHYATLNSENAIQDAKDEAQAFIKAIKSLPPYNLPPALDIEENKAHLPKEHVRQWINSFLNELATNGIQDYVLYSYTPFLNENLPADHGFGAVKLWIAHYTTNPKPTLPNGWSHYHIWQYSAKGKVTGIVGDVDMNRTVDFV